MSFQLIPIVEENYIDHRFIPFLVISTQNSIMFSATDFYSLSSLDLCKSHWKTTKSNMGQQLPQIGIEREKIAYCNDPLSKLLQLSDF